ncbi:hypothetical protein [Chloracidobacterium aggregatum]|uniref:hypothetical protein n=1 Tax=Chloracidobacterium aggregatum TaxID=2851959 RepID=UPI001B8C9C2F|nr:hypothetical protein [Chloracidobacterium aggregatum]QUV90453.1 hypothetical protein J8C04_09300 [Chloracidobacterium sp. A]
MGDPPKPLRFLTFPFPVVGFRTTRERPQPPFDPLPADAAPPNRVLDLPFPEPDEVAPLPSSTGPVTPDPAPPPEKHFNYYSYFSEIEAAFTAHRGKPYHMSPLDWALVESWQKAGIPLPVVLRGIAQACEAHARKMSRQPKGRPRPVRSLGYCQSFVEDAFTAYRASQVGAASPPAAATAPETGGMSRARVAAFLETAAAALAAAHQQLSTRIRPDAPHAHLGALLPTVVAQLRTLSGQVQGETLLHLEAVEMTLSELEDRLLAALQADVPPEVQAEAAQAATAALKVHRKGMAAAVYAQTHANYVARQLRERYGVPRLSLFYLEDD